SPRGGGFLGNEVTHLQVLVDGKVEITTQQMPHGQGHETTLAQVAADEIGVAYDDIVVRYGDNDFAPPTIFATGGSRAATMANGSVLHASRDLRHKILLLAAELMEANPDDLEIAGGIVSVGGTPAVSLSIAELSRIVTEDPHRLPPG